MNGAATAANEEGVGNSRVRRLVGSLSREAAWNEWRVGDLGVPGLVLGKLQGLFRDVFTYV